MWVSQRGSFAPQHQTPVASSIGYPHPVAVALSCLSALPTPLLLPAPHGQQLSSPTALLSLHAPPNSEVSLSWKVQHKARLCAPNSLWNTCSHYCGQSTFGFSTFPVHTMTWSLMQEFPPTLDILQVWELLQALSFWYIVVQSTVQAPDYSSPQCLHLFRIFHILSSLSLPYLSCLCYCCIDSLPPSPL